jgi:hypothetical protein
MMAALLVLPAMVLSAPTNITLAARAGSIPSLLKSPQTFYRAITGNELEHAKTIYKVGAAPASHASMAGDLSAHGALYVFHVRIG